MYQYAPEHEPCQEDARGSRFVIGYSYFQRGSTKHWDRGRADIRPAAPVEYSKPLGPCLANNNEKIVWIEVHIEADPTKVSAGVIGDYESAADSEFQKHRPGHFILAGT